MQLSCENMLPCMLPCYGIMLNDLPDEVVYGGHRGNMQGSCALRWTVVNILQKLVFLPNMTSCGGVSNLPVKKSKLHCFVMCLLPLMMLKSWI